MVGLINFPLIIFIYVIISFTKLGNSGNDYYYDILLFKNELFNIKNMILLILHPFFFWINCTYN